ncbi:UNVERIFIED_CONTAM: hypothetical protein HDU68_008124 [Siphonaria sp. JEL0065]|nr:hypothetical protein HDU68_008124 [Siphonaria sp. JEL0065]
MSAMIKNAIILVLVHLAIANATLCQCICNVQNQYVNSIISVDPCSQQTCYDNLHGPTNTCKVSDYEAKNLTGIVAGGVVGGLIFIAIVITCLCLH